MPWGGSPEGGKLSTHSETPSHMESVRSFGTSEVNAATGAWKAKRKEFTREIIAEQHFPDEKRTVLLHPPRRVGPGY